MCSTPRRSVNPHHCHRLSVSASCRSSYSHMMRDASQRHQQQQQELAEKRAKLVQKEQEEVHESSAQNREEVINEDKSIPLKEPESGFFIRLKNKLCRYIERKPSSIYHEYH